MAISALSKAAKSAAITLNESGPEAKFGMMPIPSALTTSASFATAHAEVPTVPTAPAGSTPTFHMPSVETSITKRVAVPVNVPSAAKIPQEMQVRKPSPVCDKALKNDVKLASSAALSISVRLRTTVAVSANRTTEIAIEPSIGMTDADRPRPHDVPLHREFAGLEGPMRRLPDESTILRFRHLLEKQELAAPMLATVNAVLQAHGLMLKTGTVVDASLISAPSSTKNSSGTRDPEMRQTKKGNNWYFGMKAHIGADADSGLVHTVIGTPANTNDVTQAEALLHGEEDVAFGDAGYQGAHKRPEATMKNWRVAMRPGKRKALDLSRPIDAIVDEIERLKASVRAKVEHPFRVIKRQFGFTKVRYRGLAKNTAQITAQITTLFALSNLWMARRRLMAMTP